MTGIIITINVLQFPSFLGSLFVLFFVQQNNDFHEIIIKGFLYHKY